MLARTDGHGQQQQLPVRVANVCAHALCAGGAARCLRWATRARVSRRRVMRDVDRHMMMPTVRDGLNDRYGQRYDPVPADEQPSADEEGDLEQDAKQDERQVPKEQRLLTLLVQPNETLGLKHPSKVSGLQASTLADVYETVGERLSMNEPVIVTRPATSMQAAETFVSFSELADKQKVAVWAKAAFDACRLPELPFEREANDGSDKEALAQDYTPPRQLHSDFDECGSEETRSKAPLSLEPQSDSVDPPPLDNETEPAEGDTPWTEMIMALMFVCAMYGFQNLHFDINVQHDVHASLRAELQLHIDAERGYDSTHWASITSTPAMFEWLENQLLPAVTNQQSSRLGRFPRATLSTEECRAALPLGVGDDACQSCESEVGTNSTGRLIFVNDYALLYKGILIRQTRHCTLATIGGNGELDRIRLPESERSTCKDNAMFTQTDADIEYASEHSGRSNGTSPTLPSFACYDFDRWAFANQSSADEASWVARTRIGKEEIFIPTGNGDPSAMAAAKAVLQTLVADQWIDPATASVDISFIVMSMQYGVVTEVQLTCDFHLGGHMKTDFSMRSMSPSVLVPYDGWTSRYEP